MPSTFGDVEIPASLDVASIERVGEHAWRRSAEIDGARRLPDDLSGELAATELNRAWAPAELGAPELPVADVVDLLERLAFHEASTAWNAMISITTSLLSGRLPSPWLEEIFGHPTSTTCGVAQPEGRARRVDGGIAVSGRWPWGSGTANAHFVGGGSLLVDDTGDPVRDASFRAPFVFFAADQIEILDTWHVSGLKGTGSNDFEVRDAFVPEGRWADASGPLLIDRPLYRFPFFGALALGVCAVTLGIARRAVHDLQELAASKTPARSSKTLAELATTHVRLAEAEGRRRAARALVDQAVAEVWREAERGPVADDVRAALRLAATNAAQQSAEVVATCYDLGGGAAVYEASNLQRLFRDVHVATHHGMVAPRSYETIGRIMLDQPVRLVGF